MTSSELVQLRRAPNIDRIIDNTALKAYMECPRKFFYSMILGRRSRGAPRPAIAYGKTWHTILEWHYRTGGKNTDLVYQKAVMSWEPPDDPADYRTFDRCWSEYENYLAKWGTHDEEVAAWGRTVGYPDSPLIEQVAELSWPGALHPYGAKIDRVIEPQGLYFVEDHKTTSRMGPYYFKQFDPDNQMMGYVWTAHQLTGLPIAGIRINAHCVLKRESKFERQTIYISAPRLEEWARNYNTWVHQINDALGAYKSMLANGAEPQEALIHTFPHNFMACAGKYGQCAYDGVCTYPPDIRMRILESEFDINQWDPMAEADDAGSDE